MRGTERIVITGKMLKSETNRSKKRKNVELVDENGDLHEVNAKLLAPADIKSFELFIQQFSDQGYTIDNATVRQGTLVRPVDDPWVRLKGFPRYVPSWMPLYPHGTKPLKP